MTRLRWRGGSWVTSEHVVDALAPDINWLDERTSELAAALAVIGHPSTQLTIHVATMNRSTSLAAPREVTVWRAGVNGERDGTCSSVVATETAAAALAELHERGMGPPVAGVVHRPLPAGPRRCLLSSFAASVVLHELLGHGTEVAGMPRACSFDVWSHPEAGGDATGERGDPVLAGCRNPGMDCLPTGGFRRCPPHAADHALRHTRLEAIAMPTAESGPGEARTVVHRIAAAQWVDGCARLRLPYALELDRGDLIRRSGSVVVTIPERALATAVPTTWEPGPTRSRHTGICSVGADALPLDVVAPTLVIDAVLSYE